jgi:hypothetical protein
MVKRSRIGLAAIAAASLLPGCPEQPELGCVVAHGPFAATYTLVEGTGACAEKKGDIVGLQQLFASKDRKQDLSRSELAIQAVAMASVAQDRSSNYGVIDADPAHELYAKGALDSSEPSNGFCSVRTTRAAQLELPEIPARNPQDGGTDADAGTEPDPGRPAISLRYEWSNVRILVKPSAPGQAFSADLTLTENGCTAKYRVNAVFPYHDCVPRDEEGNAAGEPDDRRCAPQPDYDAGIPVGSGINPDFPVACSPELEACVLTREVGRL